MKSAFPATAWLLVLLLLLVHPILMAQGTVAGTILGVVKDWTGAILPGAEVRVTNLETNLTKTALTDAEANFEIPMLPIGFYSVSVSMTGFKTWTLTRTELTVGERKRIDPVVKVGDLTEQVTVEATAEVMQTEKSSVEATVGQKQIRDLPLNGRNVLQLVTLVPGMQFWGRGTSFQNPDWGSIVQGVGKRDDQTEFKLDGLNANAGINEMAIGIPNIDTIAEINVETANFSAEHGRDPLQVLLVTKSGTNAFHGTLWEFHRNAKFDARNTFALSNPKLIRNQFGFTAGGPIIEDKTFFFGSYEGTRIRQETIYNSTVVSPAMLQGDFSALSQPITDPLSGQPFPNNRIPADRISSASKFFFPYILSSNNPDGRYHGVAPLPDDTDEFTVRIDHQITKKQRIYGRWVKIGNQADYPDYKPDTSQPTSVDQENVGINYTYSIAPRAMFTVYAGYLRNINGWSSTPPVGKENLTQEAGIRGFPTAGREDKIGLPTVNFPGTGYTGFDTPWGAPGRMWSTVRSGTANLNLVWRKHSFNFGLDYNDRSALGRHTSCCTRGFFNFVGQYTGDSFADYLLGLPSSSARTLPLETFGMAHSPYAAVFVQDFWKLSPTVSVNLGLRWDYWHEKSMVRGNGSTFDTTIGKAIAGEDENGQVDLTAQPVARYLAKVTEGMWIPASQAGAPPGLFRANGYLSPRIGIAWRPINSKDLVVRAGYGIFASSFRGRITGSSVVGPPYWNYESQAWSPKQMQRWETAWPDDPEVLIAPSIESTPVNVKSTKNHEWNISVQMPSILKSALTVSYVGNRVTDLLTLNPKNVAPPGEYEDLQAALPWPGFGTVNLYENIGDSWYNALQVKWERRFTQGFSYLASYAFSKHIDRYGGNLLDTPLPFEPEGYSRGRSSLDRTHILAVSSIYELPFGSGRKYLHHSHPLVNASLGGWNLSGIYHFVSGPPLTFSVPGLTLGNNYGTRPNLVGNLKLTHPSADLWFNPDALEAPPPYVFGNSGKGILDGPGNHMLDLCLMKNFPFTEDKYLQLRWEVFNAPNHVNLCASTDGCPDTNIGLPTTGRIFTAGAAREMQFGLKFIF
jgi:hypothetical protein